MTLSYPISGIDEDCYSDAWDEFISEMFYRRSDSDIFEMVIGEALYNGNHTTSNSMRKPIVFTGDGNMWAHTDALNHVIESIFEDYYHRLAYPVTVDSFGYGSPIVAVCYSPTAAESAVKSDSLRSIIRGERVLVNNRYQKVYSRRYKCRIFIIDMDMDLKWLETYDFGFDSIKIKLNHKSNIDFRFEMDLINKVCSGNELSKIARLCINKYTLNMEKFNSLEGFS